MGYLFKFLDQEKKFINFYILGFIQIQSDLKSLWDFEGLGNSAIMVNTVEVHNQWIEDLFKFHS